MSSNSTLAFLCILVSLLLYTWIARRMRKRALADADQYFLAKKSAPPNQFSDVQTAYQLQMATIYPFFLFAATGLWWIAVLNLLFYALGIGLYYLLIPKFHTARASAFGSTSTIHALIGNLHGSLKLREISAWFTIAGFTGLAAFEIIFGAKALSVLFSDSNVIYYVSIFMLSLYLVMYISLSGQAGNFKTSPLQLLFSYLGLHLLIAWVALNASVHLGPPLQWIAYFIVVLSLFMLAKRIMLLFRGPGSANWWINLSICISLGLMLSALSVRAKEFVPQFSIAPVRQMLATPHFWWIALSVSLLPLFFQFVDMSNWQRLTAVNASDDRVIREARRGLLQFAIESPLSWLLPLFLGLAFVQTTQVSSSDPWLALLKAVLKKGGVAGALLSSTVFVGLIAIFMSTAEELLAAIGLAFARDLSKEGRRIHDGPRGGVNGLLADQSSDLIKIGSRATMFAVLPVTGLFILLGSTLQKNLDQFVGIFLAFYSPLIALAPSLLVPVLIGRSASARVAFASLFGGAVVGGALGVWTSIDQNAFYGVGPWLAPTVTFCLSWGIYAFGLGVGYLRRSRVDTKPDNERSAEQVGGQE
jgi:hypothetical protein